MSKQNTKWVVGHSAEYVYVNMGKMISWLLDICSCVLIALQTARLQILILSPVQYYHNPGRSFSEPETEQQYPQSTLPLSRDEAF